MPQMAPLPWLSLMVFFILILILLISLNHFMVATLEINFKKMKKMEKKHMW